MSGEEIFLIVLWSAMGTFAFFAVAHAYGSGWWQRRTVFRLRAWQCQYCCNMIGKWAAFVGVLNCDDCVSFMASGRAPRCRVPGCREHTGARP